jgi:hypothetical protein
MEIRPSTESPIRTMEDGNLLRFVVLKGEECFIQLMRGLAVNGVPPVFPVDRDDLGRMRSKYLWSERRRGRDSNAEVLCAKDSQ